MKNAPAVFQNLMSRILGDLQWKIAFAYVDDVINFSPHFAQHLRKPKLSIKLSKCQFGQSHVQYLGFLATAEGIKACLKNVRPIMQVAPPRAYSVKMEPIRCLKKVGQWFALGPKQQAAFLPLEDDVANLPNLQQPDSSKPYDLLSNAASTQGIVVILCQPVEETNSSIPISFAFRSLSDAEKSDSVQEKDALAVYWGEFASSALTWKAESSQSFQTTHPSIA